VRAFEKENLRARRQERLYTRDYRDGHGQSQSSPILTPPHVNVIMFLL